MKVPNDPPPWHVRLMGFATMGLSLGALGLWGMSGFISAALVGIFLSYGAWNRALGYPDSTPLFALKMTAALGVVAALLWLVVRIVQVVEPFWLGLVLAFAVLIAGLVAAKRFDRWDSARVARKLQDR